MESPNNSALSPLKAAKNLIAKRLPNLFHGMETIFILAPRGSELGAASATNITGNAASSPTQLKRLAKVSQHFHLACDNLIQQVSAQACSLAWCMDCDLFHNISKNKNKKWQIKIPVCKRWDKYLIKESSKRFHVEVPIKVGLGKSFFSEYQ